MTLLAFDPDRVAWIHASMSRAIADLDAIHLNDALAAGERQRVRAARVAIADTWLPLAGRLLSCPALTSTTPVIPDLRIDTIGVVAMARQGWSTASDPLPVDAPATPTSAELQLLAQLFGTFEIADLLGSAADVDALVARLVTILCTPGAAAMLRGATGWNDVDAIGTLADLRWEVARDLAADPDGAEASELRAHVDALDRAIAALVTVSSGHLSPAARAVWLTQMAEQLDPYAAALVVRTLAPAGEELGELAATILGRWVSGDPVSGEWIDRLEPVGDHPLGPLTGDLLLPLVAADAVASRAYARAAADHPRLLFDTIDDAGVVVTILSTATDPATTSSWAAGAILRPILEWLRVEDPWRYGGMIGDFAARPVVAEALSPWLLQFHSLADEWAWTTEDGDEMLAFLVDDAEAMEVLLSNGGRWLDLSTWAPVRPDGTVDLVQLDAIAATLDQLSRLIATEEVEDTLFARWITEQLLGVAAGLVTRLVTAVPVVGGAAASGAPYAIASLTDWLTAHGVLPPDHATASARADDRYDDRVLRTAAIAVSATVAQLVDAGSLPATAMDELGDALDGDSVSDDCDARDLQHRLANWVESMHGRCDPVVFGALVAVTQTFLAGNYVNGVCE